MKTEWKQKAIRELDDYLINVAYLVFFFGVFTWYKRLILAQHQISYLHYGIVIIKSLILAKVIMIGDVLGLDRRIADKPLIYPTLYKAVVFTLWVALFTLIEETTIGLFHEQGWAEGLRELEHRNWYGMLAQSLITFAAFIPFFAVRELERVLGEGKIMGLFFRKRPESQK